MPADVERLLRAIAPALVLLAGCDAKDGTPKADVVAKHSADLGDATARGDVKPPEAPSKPRADVGEPRGAKLDVPALAGAPKVHPKTSIPDTTTPEVEAAPKLPPSSTSKQRRPRASCPSGTWCTDKASAKKHAVRGATSSLGCPSKITRGAKGIDGPLRGSELRGLDKAETKAKRADGVKNACCYGWYTRCPGGRPLLDDAGTPVVASFEAGVGSGWSCERESLRASSQARAFAAQAWLDDAAMEHASVASFGRVALELLSLGAPPELVEEAHMAALDEIRHAKTCLSLAQACGAARLEPGCLAAVPQRRADFARFAADTFIEGCVGETIAALVVTRAAVGAEGEDVRQALEGIAADEARHAALAWRMVAWAVERGGAPVRAAVLDAANRLRPTTPAETPRELEPEGIGRLGRLTGAECAQARSDGWTGIIEPMLATLQSQNVSRPRPGPSSTPIWG
ncbi:MAG: ferritin-like domain-containing protein [Nannocystales bacterium]